MKPYKFSENIKLTLMGFHMDLQGLAVKWSAYLPFFLWSQIPLKYWSSLPATPSGAPGPARS